MPGEKWNYAEAEVLELIRSSADVERVYEKLAAKRAERGDKNYIDFQIPVLALRYLTSYDARELDIDATVRARLLEFAEAVLSKIGGTFIQCASCAQVIPARSIDDAGVEEAFRSHLSTCRGF